MKKILTLMAALALFIGPSVFAQVDILPDDGFYSTYLSGRVQEIVTDENGLVQYETELSHGESVLVDTYGEELSVGDRIFIEYFPESQIYNFSSVDRQVPIYVLSALFVLAILVLTGWQGVRSLLSLGVSIALLLFGLVPMLLSGVDPLMTTVVFGLAVLFLSIFVTHGFNYQSLVSFLGSFMSILLALLIVYVVNRTSQLTGYINDEIQFLSFHSGQVIDMVRLVSASIIIGVLGVLDDITVTQVSVVRELSETGIAAREIFKKSLRVGRDHISSLVNTLIFAYVGATLPMVLFISLMEIPAQVLLSQEFIFIEIVRSLVGAIALTMAVPVTTWLATYVFLPFIKKDTRKIESACGHAHH